ncbi:toll/interleukin-1 receptor domain-containing protein [Mycobacterium marseillense]|uniref:toll/interleukin-1 receptor domain-containing protein n=1 Tax=Mycobacterium marseillense TaxID=701042 RepID=UPI00119D053E|nr:toll/interleukin-1 receptor domain-containing protein [Mycobacterium marseillense]
MLDKRARARLIMGVIEEIGGKSSSDINVVLEAYGLQRYSAGGVTSIAEILRTADDDVLVDIADHLGVAIPQSLVPPPAVTATVRSAQPLFIFASHLTVFRHFVGDISRELQLFGVTLFVAHDSIPDDATWHAEIEKALDAADAGIVFLQPQFKESDWCPQEMGWLLGRHVPVIPLNFGVTPFGPLGKIQANPERSDHPGVVTERILDRLVNQDVLRRGLVSSLVKGMQTSGSFNRTDRIWKYLRELECDSSQSAELLTAAKTNDQIYRANSALDGLPYPRAIVNYLRQQPEAEIVKNDIDAYEQFLNEQDASGDSAPF